MKLVNIITGSLSSSNAPNRNAESTDPPQRPNSYPTRKSIMSGMDMHNEDGRRGTPPASSYAGSQFNMSTPHSSAISPTGSPTPKSVAFELLFTQSPQHRARLPMRVQIFPHDTTDSIIATVKNFYGLYADGGGAKGVSFEDEQGNTLIARYENFRNNMVVYVRVIQEEPSDAYGQQSYSAGSPRLQQAYYSSDAQNLPPHQALNYGQPVSRPTSRTSRKRSTSPGHGRGRRSASASINPPLPTKKSRSRSGFKSRGSSTHGSFQELHSDGLNGYSSGDGGAGSVTSKAKSEHLGNTEISLDNIVEGGRRKRAKFESSELPLFAPPQMPAATSNSSVSPARRMEHQRSSFPYTGFSQNPFSNPPNLQSPQSYGNGFGEPNMYSTPAAQGRRTRGSDPVGRQSISTPGNSSGILPTPDPTVGSCMSEEDKDVALQLMRLGDMSNISHGRTSASTLDDTFSGRADAASSTGATSDGESESGNELPPARRIKREPSPILPPGLWKKTLSHLDDNLPTDSTEPSSDERDYEDGQDGTFKPGQADDVADNELAKPKVVKAKAARKPLPSSSIKSKVSRISKPNRPGPIVKSKKANSVSASSKGPISPTSLPSQSRKTSVASTATHQHHLGDDEEDLSSKPRCQRCRKSKKGCDRQRPCGRCQDAGLSIDQCVSEDEGNGRKGRYGRHMGVPVKKDELPQVPIFPSALSASGASNLEKSKKRKR